MTRPLTPEQLAERWDVSANTVRNMIKRGELRAFRVGRLYRVPSEAVEERESCDGKFRSEDSQDASEGSTDGGPSSGETSGDSTVTVLRRPT